MAVMRSVLLQGSRSQWLAGRARRYRFVRRAVSRFLPGETVDEALAAAQALQSAGIGALLTRLGEDVTSQVEAERTADHYVNTLERIERQGLDADLSVKPTQLGLDVSEAVCERNLEAVAERAAAAGRFVTVDMESSGHVDPTLALFRRLRERHANVGICLQSYLYRTANDVEALLPLGPTVRLVKGAYNEPRELAYPRKRDVDANFLALTRQLLSDQGQKAGARVVLGTHDIDLIQQAIAIARSAGAPPDALEVHMLYGIKEQDLRRLAGEGYRTRVLISYGEAWFAWYMRRLAERPANLFFVVQHLVAR